MAKFYELFESRSFSFGEDISMEFNEFFSKVFESEKGVLYFIYRKDFKGSTKILQGNVKDYYVNQRGYKKVKFLKYV